MASERPVCECCGTFPAGYQDLPGNIRYDAYDVDEVLEELVAQFFRTTHSKIVSQKGITACGESGIRVEFSSPDNEGGVMVALVHQGRLISISVRTPDFYRDPAVVDGFLNSITMSN